MQIDANRKLKIILTGATGMVGEGVLLTCLDHPAVEKVLVVGRQPYEFVHPKRAELIVPDFMDLDKVREQLAGFDGCFYCAGISSRGLDEAAYTHISYDIPLHFARTLLPLNPAMVFCYVTGAGTDATGKSRLMWARVKGRAENDLQKLGFKRIYNFRAGMMRPVPGQRSINPFLKALTIGLYPPLRMLLPNMTSTLHDVGIAMIRCVASGYSKSTLEVKDINELAKMK